MKRTVVLLASLVVMLCCVVACGGKKRPSAVKPAVPVRVAQALLKDVPVQIRVIGTVEALNTIAIKPQVSGQIARIHGAEGSDVQKGALLVSIDAEPYQAALRQAEATLAKSQAQARFADDQAKRYEGLVREGIVTRDQYDQLHASAESLAAAVAADRAAVANARILLGYCSIRSPIAGRTGTVALHAGNLVKANEQTILTVNQISPTSVAFNLPEKRLAELKAAMAGRQLRVEAVIPHDGGPVEVGRISFLDNAVNPATGTIRLKGLFANAARRLWPGQFTDLVLTLGVKKNVVVVPAAAVQNGQQGEYVYLVTKEQKAELRQVVTSPAGEGELVIERGVAAGETVVVEGQLRLTPGVAVTSAVPGGNGKQKP